MDKLKSVNQCKNKFTHQYILYVKQVYTLICFIDMQKRILKCVYTLHTSLYNDITVDDNYSYITRVYINVLYITHKCI